MIQPRKILLTKYWDCVLKELIEKYKSGNRKQKALAIKLQKLYYNTRDVYISEYYGKYKNKYKVII